MKISEKIANNKIAVLITGAHWIVVFALVVYSFGDMMDDGGNFQPTSSIFVISILIFDLPAVLVALFACLPLLLFRENENVYWYGVFLTSLFTITFQWLFVIKLLYNPFSKNAGKLTALSLNDD